MSTGTPPPFDTAVAELPAKALAAMIADGRLSARDALEACIDRYDNYDGVLNAVVVERIAEARLAAALADDQVAAGAPLGPLHGVPVTIKEAFDLAGQPTTWGDSRLAGHQAERTAAAPQALIDAGAIVWAKTNVPLLLGDWQTFNDLYGVTANPWDLDRTPGGSSGGSAVAIATGYSALELGSDIGGSIRFPAHYCGVFGHKPTFGAVSQRGHAVPGHAAPHDITACGPLARSADDLALAMSIIGERRFTPRRPRLHRVGVLLENPLGGRQDTEMTRVLEAVIAGLIDQGVEADPDALANIDHGHGYENYRLLNHAATSHIEGRDDEIPGARRYEAGERDYTSRYGRGSTLSHREWLKLVDDREGIRQAWRAVFERVDVVLCPVSASPAPRHFVHDGFGPTTIEVDGRPASNLDQWIWAAMASGGGLPATVAPVGVTTDGLPVGIQVIGAPDADLVTIDYAARLAEIGGGWRPPPLVPRATPGRPNH